MDSRLPEDIRELRQCQKGAFTKGSMGFVGTAAATYGIARLASPRVPWLYGNLFFVSIVSACVVGAGMSFRIAQDCGLEMRRQRHERAGYAQPGEQPQPQQQPR